MGKSTSYYKFDTYEERLAYWKRARAKYNVWRKTPAALKMIKHKTKKQQGLCFWCLKSLGDSVHVDHIFPLYLGGSNAPINMCVTHPSCNMKKGANVYTTWKESVKRRGQFNALKKANRAKQRVKRHPNTKLSKKAYNAMRRSQKLKPILK